MKAKKIEIDGQIYDFADMELATQTTALEQTVNTQHAPKITTLEQTVNTQHTPKITTLEQTVNTQHTPKITALEQTVNTQHTPDISTLKNTVNTQHTPKITTLEQTVNTNHEPRITALENKPSAGLWDSSIEQNIPFTIKNFRAMNGKLFGSSQLVQVKKSGTKLFIQMDASMSYEMDAGTAQPSHVQNGGVVLEINTPIPSTKTIAQYTQMSPDSDLTEWPLFSEITLQKKAGEENTKTEVKLYSYFRPKTQTDDMELNIGLELIAIIDIFNNEVVVLASAMSDV